ncbi:MAG: hypothetical protein ACYC4S_06475 [Rhodoferax sp.]
MALARVALQAGGRALGAMVLAVKRMNLVCHTGRVDQGELLA